MDIELNEDSKQRIHSELKTRSRSEGEQLVAIDEDGKLFSVDNDGELYYVATLDAPAIATIIDAGKEREKSTQVVVEQDTRDSITVTSRDASVTSQTSILSAVTFVTEQVTTRSESQVPIPMWIFIDKNDKQLHDDRYARRSRRWENDKALEVDSEAVAEAGTSSNAQSLPDCLKMPSKTGRHFGKKKDLWVMGGSAYHPKLVAPDISGSIGDTIGNPIPYRTPCFLRVRCRSLTVLQSTWEGAIADLRWSKWQGWGSFVVAFWSWFGGRPVEVR